MKINLRVICRRTYWKTMKERTKLFEQSLHKPRHVLPEAPIYWKDDNFLCLDHSFHTRCNVAEVTEQFAKLCNNSNYVVEHPDDETVELGLYYSMPESMQDESKVFIHAFLHLKR